MKRPTKEQLAVDVASDLTWKEIADKYNYTDSRYLRKLSVRYGLPRRRKYLKPSHESLKKMIDSGLTPYDIADKLGYSKNGWSCIYQYCREYGIKFDFRPNAHLYSRLFTEQQKSFVYGTMLGDGSMISACNGNNVVIKIGHGYKQKDYLKWKRDLLKPYVLSDELYKRSGIHPGGGISTTYTFHTITHPWLVEIHPLMYPGGIKTVSNEWLDHIDEFALAVWFMDDGSLNKRYGTMVFCTMSFSYEEHLLMQQWFKDRWGIDTVIEPRRNNHFAIRVNASIAGKLRKIISPHVIPSMKYKVEYKS